MFFVLNSIKKAILSKKDENNSENFVKNFIQPSTEDVALFAIYCILLCCTKKGYFTKLYNFIEELDELDNPRPTLNDAEKGSDDQGQENLPTYYFYFDINDQDSK